MSNENQDSNSHERLFMERVPLTPNCENGYKTRNSSIFIEKSNITSAALDWKSDGHPLSTVYDDVYYSGTSGIAETHHTFLQHNHLPERFRQLKDNELFTIGETGFGTGLNFLCAWRLFEQTACESARLHFTSTEKHPLTHDDLCKALALWPELADYAARLTNSYMPHCQGTQHLVLADGRVRLTLLIGDVLETLPQLEGSVDAWFLDGFNPAKNPEMWQPALFQTMAEKSKPGTTYATFTAAAVVRNGMMNAGFTIEKVSGFGKKRHMIKGVIEEPAPSSCKRPPWFQHNNHTPAIREAIVIGGGLAGTSVAYSLATRGWQVRLLERHNRLAQEASGNPQGILYAKLSANDTPLSRFVLQGYLYSINLLKELSKKHDGLWQNSGVIQLTTSEKINERHQALSKTFPKELLQLLDKESLEQAAGLKLDHPGLFFPEAGWVNPAKLCTTFGSHTNIRLETGIEVNSLEKAGSDWVVKTSEQKEFRASTVIMAGGTASNDPSLNQELFNHIPLKSIRGQITEVAATPASRSLKCCVCADGYAAPATDDKHTIGATFDFNNPSKNVLAQDHQKNLEMQSKWLPSLITALGEKDLQITGGRANFRCTTPDYLPAIGAVMDREAFLEDFAMLRKNLKHRFKKTAPYHEGLYITAGHGSRGLITCPLSGEILASMISGETSPVTQSMTDQLNPNRFLVRDLARNRI